MEKCVGEYQLLCDELYNWLVYEKKGEWECTDPKITFRVVYYNESYHKTLFKFKTLSGLCIIATSVYELGEKTFMKALVKMAAAYNEEVDEINRLYKERTQPKIVKDTPKNEIIKVRQVGEKIMIEIPEGMFRWLKDYGTFHGQKISIATAESASFRNDFLYLSSDESILESEEKFRSKYHLIKAALKTMKELYFAKIDDEI